MYQSVREFPNLAEPEPELETDSERVPVDGLLIPEVAVLEQFQHFGWVQNFDGRPGSAVVQHSNPNRIPDS